MDVQAKAIGRDKSMTELLVIIIVLGLLMASFISAFFEQEEEINDVGFSALANNFASQVQAIRGQWMMDGRPSRLILKEVSGRQSTVVVNHLGWVTAESCQAIWQSVLDIPLTFMNQPVGVVAKIVAGEDNLDLTSQTHSCRYALNELIFFDYMLLSGKVVVNK